MQKSSRQHNGVATSLSANQTAQGLCHFGKTHRGGFEPAWLIKINTAYLKSGVIQLKYLKYFSTKKNLIEKAYDFVNIAHYMTLKTK